MKKSALLITRAGGSKRMAAAVAMALVGSLSFVVGAAIAAPALKCGQTVNTSVKLEADVGPCSGDGLVAGKNNIVIDLNSFRIFGDGIVDNAPQVGVRVADKTGVEVESGTIDSFNAGVFITGGSGNKVKSITATDNKGTNEIGMGDGILVAGSSNNTIIGNTVKRNSAQFGTFSTFGGISLINEASDNLIDGNTATEQPSTGIRLEAGGVVRNTVSNNNSSGNGGNGMSLGFDAYDNQVLNNTFNSNSFAGIGSSFGAERAIIRGNTISGNGTNGIGLGAGTATVENNTITNNRLHGVTVPGGSLFLSEEGPEDFIRRNSVIQSNTITGNGTDNRFRNGVFVLCPKDFVSQTSTSAGGTRGTCLGPSNNYGFNVSGGHTVASNTVTGNGGTTAGTLRKDGSGNVIGSFDLLDQDRACDANTWSANTYTTANPDCTKG